MLDWPLMTAALAAERPWWPPGTAHGYHVNTFGFCVGEVLRRVTGRTVGELLSSELAGPLGAQVHIGLPAAEHGRVADFDWPGQPPAEEDPAGLSDDRLMAHNAYFNPSGLSGFGVINSAAWRVAQVPSANAHGTARGVARVYTALAAGGAVDGARIVDATALAEAAAEQVCGHDLVLQRPSRFGLGFQLTQPERPMGRNPGAFGHFGAGGSLGFCDPEAGLAIGYVTSQMGPRWQNPRNRAVIDALYDSL
jgi:CubicO group peptidase (beta-lactamase class C family)